MKKTTVSLLLAAALLLSCMVGCGSNSESADEGETTLAGVGESAVLMTVDGREITAEEYLYWACLVLDSYYYSSVYGTSLDDGTHSWVAENWDNLSLAIESYVLSYNEPLIHAEELGFAADEEVMNEYVDGIVVEYLTYYDGSEETLEDFLSQYCVSVDGFRSIGEKNWYCQVLSDFLYGEGGEYAPTDEEVLAYADDAGYFACKYVFLSIVNYYTEAGIATVREKAEQLMSCIEQSDDPTAYFAEAILEPYWNDDTEESEDGLTATASSISTVFDEAVRSLEVGEFSGVIDDTDEFGYFIIQRLAVNPDDVREECCDYLFSELVSEWCANADVQYSEAYDSIDWQSFYAALTDYRMSFSETVETE